jgi:hypothetical protein
MIRKGVRMFAWVFGSFTILSGFVGLTEFGPRSLLVSLVGILIIPGPWDLLRDRTGHEIGWGWRAAACIVLIMILGAPGG